MKLTEKYRPTKLSSVIGQNSIIKSLQDTLDNNTQSTFLFSGPSGVGKTTLAKIIANHYETEPFDIIEIDAASKSGVNDMRELVMRQETFPMGKSRTFIIDECHALSSKAWDALLKGIENPPPNNYWIFCTTEPKKIPKTIKTRCSEYKIKSVTKPTILKHLKNIVKSEMFNASEDVLQFIAASCEGSPRQALTYLEQLKNLNLEDAKSIITGETEVPEVIDFVRSLSNNGGFNYAKSIKLLKDIKSVPIETIRVSTFRYYSAIAMNNPNDTDNLKVMHQFNNQCVEQNGIGDIILRLAKLNKSYG